MRIRYMQVAVVTYGKLEQVGPLVCGGCIMQTRHWQGTLRTCQRACDDRLFDTMTGVGPPHKTWDHQLKRFQATSNLNNAAVLVVGT